MLESRSTFASIMFGDSEGVVKAKVPTTVKEDFARWCRVNGTTESDVIREFVIARTYGLETLRSMYEKRISVVAPFCPSSGSEKGHDKE